MVMVIVTVVRVMEVVLMMLHVGLRTWDHADRECSSAKGGQNEGKVSHEHLLLADFFKVQRWRKCALTSNRYL